HPYLPPARYGAKVADINSRDPGWHLLPSRCCEEQFVVFSAVQGKPKISLSGHRNFVGFDLGTHTALFANVAQVGGKPIADIDHGRRQPLFAEKASHLNSRRGMEMPGKIPNANLLPA